MNKGTGLKWIVGCGALSFFASMLWIAYAGHASTCFAFLKYVPGGDKTGHVGLVGFLALTLTWLSSFRSFNAWFFKIYYGGAAVFIFITIEEFLQILSPNRTFDLVDLACNYLGIALAWIATLCFRRGEIVGA